MDKIWVVDFDDKPYKGSNRRVYYTELAYLNSMKGYTGKVTVHEYNLGDTKSGTGKEFYDNIAVNRTTIKKRSNKIDNLLTGKEIEVDHREDLIKLWKKYQPDNRFIRDFETALIVDDGGKKFKSLFKRRKRILLYNVTTDVEFYKAILRVEPIKKIDNIMPEMLSNFNKAKEELGM